MRKAIIANFFLGIVISTFWAWNPGTSHAGGDEFEFVDELTKESHRPDDDLLGADRGIGHTLESKNFSMHVGLFGNIDLLLWESDDDTVFNIGLATLDIFFASRAWDKLFAMADIVFDDNGNFLDAVVDRYMFRFDWTKYFQIGAGQIHNPLQQWNRRVSHGFYLQTPISRPKVVDREVDEGIWPTHQVALFAEGKLSKSGKIGYFASVANGRAEKLTEIQIRDDANRQKAYTLNFNYSPFEDGRFRLDTTYYHDKIPAPQASLIENDLGVSAQFENRHLELRSEFNQMWLDANGGPSSGVSGFYGLLGYKIHTRLGEVRPFGMTSHLFVDETFTGLDYFLIAEIEDNLHESLLGVRWEPLNGFAVKAEALLAVEDGEYNTDIALQFAFAF